MWLLALMAGALVVGRAASQETWEYVAHTPPPGWSVQHTDGGRQYLRNDASGIGLISLLASRPASGAPAESFADIWRTEATKILAGPPPPPSVRQSGDGTVLTGARQTRSQGTTVRVVVAAVLRRDRVVGIMGTASGPARQGEVEALFNSLGVEPSTTNTAPAESATGIASGGVLGATPGELGFDLPAGYVQQRNGDVVILAPATTNEQTPCLYGLAPPRSAPGSLEAEAEAALAQTVVPGWRRRAAAFILFATIQYGTMWVSFLKPIANR